MFYVHGMKECATCGEEFKMLTNSQKYCSEDCRRKGKAQNERERRKRLGMERKLAPVPKDDPLSEIARKANALGLTYGKFVAMMKGR